MDFIPLAGGLGFLKLDLLRFSFLLQNSIVLLFNYSFVFYLVLITFSLNTNWFSMYKDTKEIPGLRSPEGMRMVFCPGCRWWVVFRPPLLWWVRRVPVLAGGRVHSTVMPPSVGLGYTLKCNDSLVYSSVPVLSMTVMVRVAVFEQVSWYTVTDTL